MLYILNNMRLPRKCGKGCDFCKYDASDDMYHCIFFKDIETTEIINDFADEKEKYIDCPVRSDEEIVYEC